MLRIEPIGRLNRYVLAELLLREHVAPQPVCYACEQPSDPLVPYELAKLRSTHFGQISWLR